MHLFCSRRVSLSVREAATCSLLCSWLGLKYYIIVYIFSIMRWGKSLTTFFVVATKNKTSKICYMFLYYIMVLSLHVLVFFIFTLSWLSFLKIFKYSTIWYFSALPHILRMTLCRVSKLVVQVVDLFHWLKMTRQLPRETCIIWCIISVGNISQSSRCTKLYCVNAECCRSEFLKQFFPFFSQRIWFEHFNAEWHIFIKDFNASVFVSIFLFE